VCCYLFVRFGKLSGASTSLRRANAAVDKIASTRGLRRLSGRRHEAKTRPKPTLGGVPFGVKSALAARPSSLAGDHHRA
jgi:hypothetical protein